MGALGKFKRDITKHRGKAAVLGILFVTMAALTMRAVFEMRPHTAVASNLTTAKTMPKPSDAAAPGANATARMQESKNLWNRLKEVKANAADAKIAFTFDPSYYPPPIVVEATPSSATPEVKPAPAAPVDEAAIRAARIREQARSLVVKSTAVGNGTMEPMAIVNQQLLTVGQKIMGFEISAIRAREVEFTKDGVTTVVRMPDGQ
jgi:hypothetical protein